MRFATALCGGLLMTFGALHEGDAGLIVTAARAAGTERPAPTPDAPTVRESLPDRAFRVWPQRAGEVTAPSFAPDVFDPPQSAVAFAPNPLVSSEHRATPEYEYLYTAARIDRAPPRLTSYQYPADNSYLINAAPAHRATAWPYQWRRRPLQQIVAKATRAAAATARRDEPAVARAPGQKIDEGIGAAGALTREAHGGPWRLSPALGDLDLGDDLRPAR